MSCGLLLYLHHSFTFPHVPYTVALHYIHTPELFMHAHALVPPGARILKTNPHCHAGSYDALHFTFTAALLGTRHATVFSNEAASSHLLLLDEDRRPYMLATLSVRAEGQGHRLLVTGSRLRTPTAFVDRMRWPVDRATIKGAIQLGYRHSVGRPEDANMRAYRASVLQLC